MDILVVTQYFYPENFKINDLVESFVNRGHRVTVLTSKPNYPKGEFYEGYKFSGIVKEKYNGADIIRVPQFRRKKAGSVRLILNYLSFAFFASLYVLRHRINCDVTFCYEASPITQMYPALLHKKLYKSKAFIWVQDLWPESISSVGKLRNKYVLSVLDKMVKSIYHGCDGIFVQSQAFIKSILPKCPDENKICYAPNWAEDIFTNIECSESKLETDLPEGFKIMFAGNVGAAQDISSILRAASLTKDIKNIHWIILGDGRYLPKAKVMAKEYDLSETVHFLGRYPMSWMPLFYKQADVMLIALKNEYIFSLTIPSKTQTYMAAGKPILTMINGVCNDVIKEAGCGLTADSGDFRKLAENAIALSEKTSKELYQIGKRGQLYYNSHFDKNLIVDKIIQTMSEK